MGTTQSHSQKRHRGKKEGYSAGPSDVTHHPGSGKAASPRGKPSPPTQPLVSNITHNSVTLSWQPPRRNLGSTVFAYTIEMSTPTDPKTWTVITKCCQGNSYQAKNLSPSSQYIFRVRAENIHGTSKSSRPSEVVETKMFGVEQQMYVPAPEDRVSSVPHHQHSISLHLEGTVTSILNHTDIKVLANTSKEVKVDDQGSIHRSLEALANEDDADGQGRRWRSSSLQRDGHLRCSVQSDRPRINSLQRDFNERSSLQPERWRSNSLQREANQRSSLQPSRKRSLPLLLPGTRTDSLNKLRDSQTFPITLKNRLNETSAMGRKRGLTLRERSVSESESISESGSKEDIVDGKMGSSKDESSTDDFKPAKRDSGLEEDADNPWEKDDSSSEAASDGGLSSTCEDKKMDLQSHSLPDRPASPWLGVALHGMVITPGGESGQADFRMLRSLLHSDDIIVKPSHSLPDIGVLGRKASPQTLTTILDLDEEEDSVRITTL